MIFIDDRGGSCELVAPLRKLGLPVEETRLDSGDIVFEGKGVGGVAVMVGIEYKKLPELISSLRTERLQGVQLPDMDKMFDDKWLFVEGEVLYDDRGHLMEWRMQRGRKLLQPMKGGMTVGELYKRIFVLRLCGGLQPWFTTNQRQTTTSIQILYRTWTDKALDEHRSHLGNYIPPSLVPISDERACFLHWPGLGDKASRAVERYFGGSLYRAVNAPEAEWAEIEVGDRRLGPATAKRVVEFLRK